jgi:inhibitor of cysteine peptidase
VPYGERKRFPTPPSRIVKGKISLEKGERAMKITVNLVCVLVLMLGLLCGTTAVSAGAGESTFKDPSKPVSVKNGDSFTIEMPSNQTTGFAWALADSYDAKILAKDRNDYKAPSGTPGAGGVELWKFHALSKGSTKLSFAYRKPWEKNVKPAKIMEFTVTVK